MNEPLVSVVIPTYNRRRWIGECLDSVRAQTHPNVETLVIDDGSTDGTVEWLRAEPRYAFADVRVQPRNAGASEARNAGVRAARGEFIVFIDSDDLLEPTHLATAVATFAQHPEVALFCCDTRMIGPDGEWLHEGRTWHEINAAIKRYPVRSGLRNLHDVFVFSNSFPGFTLRRSVFDAVGFLDQSIFPLDDYDLALRIAGRGFGVYYHHEPLARYRDHGANCSGAANAVRVGREKYRCLLQALERNPELRRRGGEVRRRLAEVQLESALSQVQGRHYLQALGSLLRSAAHHPAKLADFLAHRLSRAGRRAEAIS